jgi:superfamily II DNA or RNA helicase
MAGFVCDERLTYGPWPALERLVARLAVHAGFRDVTVVGGTGDGGADVVASIRGTRWVFQVKFRYSGGIDAEAAKEAVRAMGRFRCDTAVAVCNSYFDAQAYDYHRQVSAQGVDLRLWPGSALLEYYGKLPLSASVTPTLRDYQVEAVDEVERHRGSGRRAALVVMATGLGKSVVATQLLANELSRNPAQEVLVVAHAVELIAQLERSSWPLLTKDVSTHVWAGGEAPAYPGGIIFATWQSLHAAIQRGDSLSGRFSVAVVDEAHHAPSIGYRRLLDELGLRFLIGMTATPWRTDGQGMLELFGSPAYTLDIVTGMQRGFLTAVDYRMLTDGIDWDRVSRLSAQGLTVKDLNRHLLLPERDLGMVATICAKMAEVENPRALAFCRSIDHADRLKPLFAARGVRTAVMHSQLSREERFYNMSAFRRGSLDLLISVEMLNEGIDVPDVNLIAFMRVTHSRRIFLQQLGRGLRISPGKEKVVVLDFVADIRRVAAGLKLNTTAAKRARELEVIRYRDGQIVKFDNDVPASFFQNYLADIASVEDLEEDARLRFPHGEVF